MTLGFPGGEVAIPAPTREALLLSVRQWVTAAKERAYDDGHGSDSYEARDYVLECCDKALAALTEAEGLK